MAAVFPWARKSRFRIMIVDTTLAVSGLPRPVCAPPVETKPERRRTHPRRVPVVHDCLVHLEGIVKLRLKAVSDAQHGGFATGLSPVSWGSIDELFVNLTIPCRVMRLSRAAYYRPPVPASRRDAAVIAALTDVVARYPRWGFWKCFDRLGMEGRPWNHKHVHRVYCALRLNLPRRTTRRVPRRVRQPLAAPPVLNRTWALDFMSETLYDGRRVRLLTVIDEGNREGFEIAMGLSVPSQRVVRVLNELVAVHDCPAALRTACYEQVVKALGAVGSSNRGTDTGSGSVEPAHRVSSGLIPEERRVPGGSTSSCLRREELRTTVGMASSPVGAGASGFYAAIDSSLHTWSASNAVRFLTTANA